LRGQHGGRRVCYVGRFAFFIFIFIFFILFPILVLQFPTFAVRQAVFARGELCSRRCENSDSNPPPLINPPIHSMILHGPTADKYFANGTKIPLVLRSKAGLLFIY